MTPREWTTLGFRLVALYLVLRTLLQLPEGILFSLMELTSALGGGTLSGTLLVLLSIFGPAIAGVIILWKTDWFVDKAFESVLARFEENQGEDDGVAADQETPGLLDFTTLERDDIFAVSLSLMGVYILSIAIPDGIAIVGNAMSREAGGLSGILSIFSGATAQSPFAVVAEIVIGLVLFTSSYAIVRFWSRRQRPSAVDASTD